MTALGHPRARGQGLGEAEPRYLAVPTSWFSERRSSAQTLRFGLCYRWLLTVGSVQRSQVAAIGVSYVITPSSWAVTWFDPDIPPGMMRPRRVVTEPRSKRRPTGQPGAALLSINGGSRTGLLGRRDTVSRRLPSRVQSDAVLIDQDGLVERVAVPAKPTTTAPGLLTVE